MFSVAVLTTAVKSRYLNSNMFTLDHSQSSKLFCIITRLLRIP